MWENSQSSDESYVDNSELSTDYYDSDENSEIVHVPKKRKLDDFLDIPGLNEVALFCLNNKATEEVGGDTLSDYHKSLKQKIDEINKTEILGSESVISRILDSKMDLSLKARLVSKVENPFLDRSDRNKTDTWISEVLKLPLNNYKEINVNNINDFLLKCRKKLDEAVYGMESVKEEIVDFLCNYIKNPQKTGTVLALQGPKGVGKTRICRALSEILELPLFQISMGGLSDSSVLLGHDSTYVGSKCGRIANFLQKAKCMNFILYIDEMDKIGDTGKSKEVQGVLTHLLDETQNKEFQDVYFEGVPIDLSRVFFITSFNDHELIDPIVLNRMKIINIKSLSINDKINICKNYILPELNYNSFIFSDEIIKYIVVYKTIKEKGMRNIKKNFETVINRLNTIKTLANCKDKHDITKNFSYKELMSSFKFNNDPVNIDKKTLNILLGGDVNLKEDESWKNMYI